MHLLLGLACALIIFSGVGFTILGGIAFLKATGAGIAMVGMTMYGLGMIALATAFLFAMVGVVVLIVLGWGGAHVKIDFKWPL